jgi:hypothetical protein
MIEDYSLVKIDGFVLSVLYEGCWDWVQPIDIVSRIFYLHPAFHKDVSPEILQEIAKSSKESKIVEFNMARALNNAIIKKVLTEGFMEIGDIPLWVEPYFKAWPLTIEESLQKVEAEWDKLQGHLPGGGIYWLNNTPYGMEMGEKADLQRQQWIEAHPDYCEDY